MTASPHISGAPATRRDGTMSNEFDLLCAGSGVELAPDRAAMIAALSRSSIDWQELLHLAEHHGVMPLLARNLKVHSVSVPVEIAPVLGSAYETNLRRSLWFASELARITAHLEAKKLLAVPYKGPV